MKCIDVKNALSKYPDNTRIVFIQGGIRLYYKENGNIRIKTLHEKDLCYNPIRG